MNETADHVTEGSEPAGRSGTVDRSCACPRRPLRRAIAVGSIATLALVAWQQPPRAQSIPGLVVTTTPPPQPGAGPPPGMMPPPGVMPRPVQPAPQAAAPPAPEKVKPKPKPTAKRQASAAPVVVDDSAGNSLGIVALVNDEPITAYEVQELTKFLLLSVNFTDRAKANMKAIAENPKTNERLQAILQETIKANPGKSREQIIAAFEERKKQFVVSLQQQAIAGAKSSFVPGLRKKALEELIEDRLKMQEAKKLNIVVPDDEVDKAFKGLAERNQMTPDQFAAHIKTQGADARTMKARFKSTFTWREVVKRRYGHQISVSSREVDRIAAAAGGKAEELTELQLQRITLGTAGQPDQTAIARQYAEAQAMQQRFAGCKTTQAIAKGRANARFEDLGYRKAASIAEPTRTLLLAARDGEMLPPTLTASGAELYAVCARRVAKVDETKRAQAENELQMREFERLATRHLADLRKDALIEIK